MNTLLILILALAVTTGQLIKIPISTQGGLTILDIIVSLFCLIGLFKIKFNPGKPPPQIASALIFISISTISLSLTPLSLNLGEYFVSFSYTLRFFLYVLFAWLAFSNAFGNFKNHLSNTFLLSGIAFAGLGVLQFAFFPNLDFLSSLGWDPHYFRTVSTFFDPNFAGAFLVLTLLLLISHPVTSYLGGRSDRTPGVFVIIFTILYLALLTTFSRSSYGMFLISGLTFSFLKKSKTLAIATILLFIFLLAGFQIYTHLVAKPRNIDRTKSASFRLNTWQQGLILFQKSPVLGIGHNAYRYGIEEYKLGDDSFLKSHGSSSNDFSLLFVAATSGIIGLVSFLYFLFSLVKQDYSNNQIIAPAVAGLLFHSFFANSLFYPPILAWLLFISIIPKK